MPLPSFIIGGAPKAGTTALWAYLADHPEVFMPGYKEPHFFSRMQEDMGNGIVKPGPRRAITFSNGLQWYEDLFKPGSSAKARGEASTHYFSAPDSAGLIRAHVPDVRLIFLLRDPVERLYSQYWQLYKSGWSMPKFESMFHNNHPALAYYCYVSSYKMHLERFYSEFSPEHILILFDVDLKRQPMEVLQRVYRFIDVDPGFIPSALGSTFNPNRFPRSRFIERLLTILRHSWLSREMPDGWRQRFSSTRRFVSKLNAVQDRYPPMPVAIRSELVKRFEGDISFVENLLGVNLDSWRTVDPQACR